MCTIWTLRNKSDADTHDLSAEPTHSSGCITDLSQCNTHAWEAAWAILWQPHAAQKISWTFQSLSVVTVTIQTVAKPDLTHIHNLEISKTEHRNNWNRGLYQNQNSCSSKTTRAGHSGGSPEHRSLKVSLGSVKPFSSEITKHTHKKRGKPQSRNTDKEHPLPWHEGLLNSMRKTDPSQ